MNIYKVSPKGSQNYLKSKFITIFRGIRLGSFNIIPVDTFVPTFFAVLHYPSKCIGSSLSTVEGTVVKGRNLRKLQGKQ